MDQTLPQIALGLWYRNSYTHGPNLVTADVNPMHSDMANIKLIYVKCVSNIWWCNYLVATCNYNNSDLEAGQPVFNTNLV